MCTLGRCGVLLCGALLRAVPLLAAQPALTVTAASVTNNTTVSVTGTGFASGTLALTIAGQPLTNLAIGTSGTQLTATLPRGLAVGTYTLLVTRTELPASVCTSVPPGPDWVCINGGWVPSNHPLIKDAAIVSTAQIDLTLTSTSAALAVLSAAYDAASGELRIRGQAFGSAPAVVLDGQAVTVSSSTDTEIVAALPGLTGTSYRLVVSDSTQARTSDPFELTVGPIGPQGSKGETGATGATGAQGPPGPNIIEKGSVSYPSLSFVGDDDTGLYSPAAGVMGIASDGAPAMALGQTITSLGYQALLVTSTGANNTAVGAYALHANTTGEGNTAFGYKALASNTIGSGNTATGVSALMSNRDTGSWNTATGVSALASNTTGSRNTALGVLALATNRTGMNNTAIGYNALARSIGDENTAVGSSALGSVTTSGNTAVGDSALQMNTTGEKNTAVGAGALAENKTGSFNVALGFRAGYFATGSNNIFIGNYGYTSADNQIMIGDQETHRRTYIAGISGVTTGLPGVPVVIDSNGQLGTIPSSRRFKQDIHDLGDVSALLRRLRPVTFRYRQKASDGTRPLQYGLIAEEVAAVDRHLVQYGADGQVSTVFYQFLPPLLLGGYQAQQQIIETQAAELHRQASRVAAQADEIADLQARLAQLEALLRPVPSCGRR